MQVVGAAAEAGLLADVAPFHDYREARNITSYSYDRLKAERIVSQLPRFAADVAYLLTWERRSSAAEQERCPVLPRGRAGPRR